MRLLLSILCVLTALTFFTGCESGEKSTSGAKLDDLTVRAKGTVDRAVAENPGIKSYLDKCAGYVAFPEVAKGGLVIGGSHGVGAVFERRAVAGDKVIGTADMTAGSIGLQIGGQTYSEILFFEDALALQKFKDSNFELAANATGVAIKTGASVQAEYENGVAVFIFGEKGLMGEASVGGQKFKFHPVQ
jgi:lipid-binding SYLF domain-containing protein